MPTAKIVEIQDCEGNQAWQISAYFDACLTWWEPDGPIYYSFEDAVSSAVAFGYKVVKETTA